jgi:hypothetical protein
MKHLPFLLLAACLFAITAAAHADTITFGSVSPISLTPSADVLSLSAGSATVTTPGTVSQSGDLNIGNSQIPDTDVPFTFTDSVTVNGNTEILTFTGDDDVTTAADTLTINALGPVSIGGDVLTFGTVTFVGTDLGDNDFSLTASVTGGGSPNIPAAVPEPSALVLCGTGLLSIAGAAKRKFFKS